MLLGVKPDACFCNETLIHSIRELIEIRELINRTG